MRNSASSTMIELGTDPNHPVWSLHMRRGDRVNTHLIYCRVLAAFCRWTAMPDTTACLICGIMRPSNWPTAGPTPVASSLIQPITTWPLSRKRASNRLQPFTGSRGRRGVHLPRNGFRFAKPKARPRSRPSKHCWITPAQLHHQRPDGHHQLPYIITIPATMGVMRSRLRRVD
jgi:hypothetical protein